MTREEDIQKVIDGILNITPNFWDNPNGGYEYSCPFCNGEKTIEGNELPPTMKDIEHDIDCIWLIAQDLNTGKN